MMRATPVIVKCERSVEINANPAFSHRTHRGLLFAVLMTDGLPSTIKFENGHTKGAELKEVTMMRNAMPIVVHI